MKMIKETEVSLIGLLNEVWNKGADGGEYTSDHGDNVIVSPNGMIIDNGEQTPEINSGALFKIEVEEKVTGYTTFKQLDFLVYNKKTGVYIMTYYNMSISDVLEKTDIFHKTDDVLSVYYKNVLIWTALNGIEESDVVIYSDGLRLGG